MKHLLLILGMIASLSACTALPDKAYRTPGQPESLLNKSSERVTFNLKAKTAPKDVTQWIDKDQPTRAQLLCKKGEADCQKAERVLSSFSVPFTYGTPVQNKEQVVLIYERVVAQKCDNRFISNHHNFRNLNYPSFGCSVASNTLNMVSDHQQIIKPTLSSPANAHDAVHAIHHGTHHHHHHFHGGNVGAACAASKCCK